MMDVRTRISWGDGDGGGGAGKGQPVTDSHVSEHSLNLVAADKELGINKLILHVICKTKFTGLLNGLIIHIIDGTRVDDTTGEINLGERILNSTRVIPQADFAIAGGHWQLPLPPGKLQQFLGARYEPGDAGEPGVGGTFIAWFDEQAESEVVV